MSEWRERECIARCRRSDGTGGLKEILGCERHRQSEGVSHAHVGDLILSLVCLELMV